MRWRLSSCKFVYAFPLDIWHTKLIGVVVFQDWQSYAAYSRHSWWKGTSRRRIQVPCACKMPRWKMAPATRKQTVHRDCWTSGSQIGSERFWRNNSNHEGSRLDWQRLAFLQRLISLLWRLGPSFPKKEQSNKWGHVRAILRACLHPAFGFFFSISFNLQTDTHISSRPNYWSAIDYYSGLETPASKRFSSLQGVPTAGGQHFGLSVWKVLMANFRPYQSLTSCSRQLRTTMRWQSSGCRFVYTFLLAIWQPEIIRDSVSVLQDWQSHATYRRYSWWNGTSRWRIWVPCACKSPCREMAQATRRHQAARGDCWRELKRREKH
jgi:hypothetical protein